MILYHGTTGKRAQQIFRDRAIKTITERFFTEEENGDGYSTQGFVYLSNEPIFALHFAVCHARVDKSDSVFLFKVEISNELLEADYDELRYQDPAEIELERYGNAFDCSLLEYKTCRVPFDILLSLDVHFAHFDISTIPSNGDLFDNVGYNWEYATSNYTELQRQFLERIQWNIVE